MRFSKLTKDTVLLSIKQVFYKFSTFVILFFLARRYTTTEVGLYLFIFSSATLFLLYSNSNLNILIQREIAKDKSKSRQYLSNILSMRVFLSLISIPLIIVISFLLYREHFLVIVIMSMSVIIDYITVTFSSLFLAHRKIKYNVIIGIIPRLMLLSLVLLTIFSGLDLKFIALAHLLVSICFFGGSAAITWIKITHFNLDFNIPSWMTILRKAMPLVILSIMLFTMDIISNIMLSLISNFTQVAFFNAASTLISSVRTFPNLFIILTFPIMSKMHKERNELMIFYRKSARKMVIVSVILLFLFFIFAEQLILLVYGEKFYDAILVLRIFSLALPILVINRLNAVLLIAVDKVDTLNLVLVFAIILNILLNTITIPVYGAVGAALSVLIVNLGVICVLSAKVKNALKEN